MVFITPYSKRTPSPEGQAELRDLFPAKGVGDRCGLGRHISKRATAEAQNPSLAGLAWLARLARLIRLIRLVQLTLLVLCCFCAMPWASAQSVNVQGVQLSDFKLERQDDAYVLSSTLNFELPQAVEDALSKGIALYFMAEVQVAKERWYWYDKYLARQERHYRLSYNPLSRRWRLATSSKPINNSGLGVTMGVPYDSLSEALSAIKRSSEWRVVDSSEIEPGGKYRLDYQFKLDLTQFPRPFQIGTLGESDWSMSVKRSQAMVYESSKTP
jgi:hypothetical protein